MQVCKGSIVSCQVTSIPAANTEELQEQFANPPCAKLWPDQVLIGSESVQVGLLASPQRKQSELMAQAEGAQTEEMSQQEKQLQQLFKALRWISDSAPIDQACLDAVEVL